MSKYMMTIDELDLQIIYETHNYATDEILKINR
jgi:hypothetical protein